MLTEPKSIYLSVELEYPPFEGFAISDDEVRSLYNSLFEAGQYQYENLELQAKGGKRRLSTRRDDPQGESRCEIGDRSILIVEDNPHMPVEDFAGCVTGTLSQLGESLPPLVFQRLTIRCLSQPRKCEDSLDLLADRLGGIIDKIDPFERPPSFFGVRFRFAPSFDDDDDEVGDPASGMPKGLSQGFATVRFETYDRDPKQVWMELRSSYPLSPRPDLTEQLNVVRRNIVTGYEFLAEKCKGFLDQFDEDDTDQAAHGNQEGGE